MTIQNDFGKLVNISCKISKIVNRPRKFEEVNVIGVYIDAKLLAFYIRSPKSGNWIKVKHNPNKIIIELTDKAIGVFEKLVHITTGSKKCLFHEACNLPIECLAEIYEYAYANKDEYTMISNDIKLYDNVFYCENIEESKLVDEYVFG